MFYRNFEGYIQPSVELVNYFGDVYRVTRPGNTGDGFLQGFEIGYQQFYDNLPGIFGGWVAGKFHLSRMVTRRISIRVSSSPLQDCRTGPEQHHPALRT